MSHLRFNAASPQQEFAFSQTLYNPKIIIELALLV